MIEETKGYLISSLKILGLAVFADFVFLLIFFLLSNFSIPTSYILQRIFVFALIFIITYVVFKINIPKEIKAAIVVVPLQIVFLFFCFLSEYFVLHYHLGTDSGVSALLNWFMSLAIPFGLIFYLVFTKKYWQYIFSIFIAFLPIIYIFFIQK